MISASLDWTAHMLFCSLFLHLLTLFITKVPDAKSCTQLLHVLVIYNSCSTLAAWSSPICSC
ncbi:hypothetical protein RND71_035304 [Anisodus tanguticus]|uniref:Uncharacterized protein n=1 Tax=Anisodus tanguticus TaxID=243964 RepID=A0AAE1UUC7_9SOLA|nr:hypothetical protein RND71_035304 [Anisodus tanguticus]